MRTVWKFELKVGMNKIKIPTVSEMLTVGEQEGKIMMWAEVDSKDKETERVFLVVGTGEEIGEDLALDYMGSTKVEHKERKVMQVWHVFEIL